MSDSPQSPGALADELADETWQTSRDAMGAWLGRNAEVIGAALRAADRPETPRDVNEIARVIAEKMWEGRPKRHTDDDGAVHLRPRWSELTDWQRQNQVTLVRDAAEAVSRLARGPQQALPEETVDIEAGIEAFRRTTSYWAPELFGSHAHLSKMVENIVAASGPQPKEGEAR